MRAFLLSLAAVGTLATGAPVLAQSLKVNPNVSIDVTGFSGDANTLPYLADSIEASGAGRVAAIAYNNVAGTPGYVAIVAEGSNISIKRLDTPTSKPGEISEASTPAWMLSMRNQRRAAIVQTAKVSLADAIRTAQKSEDGAPAVVAGIARSAANPTSDVHAYMVGILRDGKLQPVAVDSKTGLVISNPEALTL